MLGIHPNSAVLFYRKIRQVISFHLTKEAVEVFHGEVEIDGSCSREYQDEYPNERNSPYNQAR